MTDAALDLPEGFRGEDLRGYGFVISTNRAAVTVDVEHRCYRAGMTHIGRSLTTKSCKGRGWKAALFADAIAWLVEVSR